MRLVPPASPWPSVAYQATALSFRAQRAIIHQVALVAPEGLR